MRMKSAIVNAYFKSKCCFILHSIFTTKSVLMLLSQKHHLSVQPSPLCTFPVN